MTSESRSYRTRVATYSAVKSCVWPRCILRVKRANVTPSITKWVTEGVGRLYPFPNSALPLLVA